MTDALHVDDITVTLGRSQTTILDGVSLRVAESSIHALIGESGSGKSTLARAAVGLVPVESGTVRVGGVVLQGRPAHSPQLAQMVFQDPVASLDPRHNVSRIIGEAVDRDPSVNRDDRIIELCEMVSLPLALLDRLPSQLSGGQCQRVAIARAIAPRPKLLVADEITSALDVTVQAQIVDLMERLASQLKLAILFITHDLAVADGIADELTVLQRGRVVERGVGAMDRPSDPYTKRLIGALLSIERPSSDAPRRRADSRKLP